MQIHPLSMLWYPCQTPIQRLPHANLTNKPAIYPRVYPRRLLTNGPYAHTLSLPTDSYSVERPEPFLAAPELSSPPLVSLLLLTIWSLGSGGAAAAVGASFSAPPTLDCRRRLTASFRRPCRALGKREELAFEDLEEASMRASDDAASREGGRERDDVGVLEVLPIAAKEVELRGSTGGCFERVEDVGAEGSSARSHIAVDCERAIRSRPLPTRVGAPEMDGRMKLPFRLLGVGGVRPMPELTKVEPVLDPEPSRLPDEDAGRRRFMPTPDARLTLRLPLEPVPRRLTSTSSQARTSSSAIWRTRTAPSCCTSHLMRS
jgi:hypothetical protein